MPILKKGDIVCVKRSKADLIASVIEGARGGLRVRLVDGLKSEWIIAKASDIIKLRGPIVSGLPVLNMDEFGQQREIRKPAERVILRSKRAAARETVLEAFKKLERLDELVEVFNK